MWVVTFKDTPVYWLHGSTTFTVGRRDTDIVILEDSSISRTHLSITVGKCPQSTLAVGVKPISTAQKALQPAPLTFADASKYGTVLSWDNPNNSNTKIEIKLKKETITSPPSVESLILHIGSHDAIFNVQWQPFFFLCDKSFLCDPRANLLLSKCGGIAVNAIDCCGKLEQLTYSLSESLFDSIFALITIDLAPTGIIFAALCLGKPIVGPQFLESIFSRLNPSVPLPDPAAEAFLPPVIHSFWNNTYKEFNSTSLTSMESLFKPNKERTRLFSQFFFVVVQECLYKELRGYLPLCRGDVIYDSCPIKEDACDIFFSKHSNRHLIILPVNTVLCENEKEIVPPAILQRLMENGMNIVSYLDIVKSVIFCDNLISRTVGRKEDRSSVLDDISMLGLRENRPAWRNRPSGAIVTLDTSSSPVVCLRPLPSLPCFQTARVIPPGSKSFRKQSCVPSESYVSFKDVVRIDSKDGRSPRPLTVDDDDLVPISVAQPRPVQERFNSIDTASHHKTHKKESTKKLRLSPSLRYTKTAPPIKDPEGSIFDIENLY
eukprot:Tbor_TRINITY_DN1114_c0_g1::TRINITY_DN1114_c0_g1_i1::g.15592::m.15592/K10867/NBN, NBS1; nibrin